MSGNWCYVNYTFGNIFQICPATKGEWVSKHAKCMVVDARFTLITSTNFTNRGQIRNIEAGALIDSTAFAQEFLAHWMRLVELGVFKEA